MHGSVMAFCANQIDRHHLAAVSTLEVGSYDVNGSVRSLFTGPYIGVDMQAGPGVDRVAVAADLPFADSEFGVVISTEMLEHDFRPWLSIAEMARVLRPGGTLIVTARGYDTRGCFPVHDYPQDLWRFSTGAFKELFDAAGVDPVTVIDDPEVPGVLATGTRR